MNLSKKVSWITELSSNGCASLRNTSSESLPSNTRIGGKSALSRLIFDWVSDELEASPINNLSVKIGKKIIIDHFHKGVIHFMKKNLEYQSRDQIGPAKWNHRLRIVHQILLEVFPIANF